MMNPNEENVLDTVVDTESTNHDYDNDVQRGFDGEEAQKIANMTNNNDDIEPPLPDYEDASEEPEQETIRIVSATPITIVDHDVNGRYISTLAFLCRDMNDKLVTICRNFELKDKEEQELLDVIPFHNNNANFINDTMNYINLTKYLPSYISDFKFYVEERYNTDNNPIVYTYATKFGDISKEKIRIDIDAEVYAAMNFIDSYVFDGIENEYDLNLAVSVGYKNDHVAKFFLVDSIEDIISIAPTVRQPKGIKKLFKKAEIGTGIALVLKINKFISNTEKEVVSLLTPFDTGIVFEESKFRGSSIESLEEKFYGDSDQYVSTLIVNTTRLHGIDKEFMTIRGKNKDGQVRIFLFDTTIVDKLIKMIEEY